MTNFNERTHFFIKIYLSHFILERVNVGCVWEVSWRRGQTATYWPNVLLTIAAVLPHSAGLLNHGSLRAQALCLELVLTPLASYLQLTQAVCVLVIFLFDIHLLPLIYISASLDWRLGRGSICNISFKIKSETWRFGKTKDESFIKRVFFNEKWTLKNVHRYKRQTDFKSAFTIFSSQDILVPLKKDLWN